MKNNLLFVAMLIVLGIVLSSNINNSEGSPSKKTGSPLDQQTCAQCHTSQIQEVNWINAEIPKSGWMPGETYKIYLNAESETAVVFGFEITAEADAAKIGTFSLIRDNRTRFSIQDKAVTHSAEGTQPTDGKIKWEMNWTAPTDYDGAVTFYAAFNAANGDASSGGDQISASNVSFVKNTTGVNDIDKQVAFKIYPNPTTNILNIHSPALIKQATIGSASGQTLKTFGNINSTNYRFDVSALSKGNYLMVVETTDGKATQQFQVK